MQEAFDYCAREFRGVDILVANAGILLVDRPALELAQAAGDVLRANEILMDAFYTDVRGDLASWREWLRR